MHTCVLRRAAPKSVNYFGQATPLVGVGAGQQCRMGHCGKRAAYSLSCMAIVVWPWGGALSCEGDYSAINAKCEESVPWAVYALLLSEDKATLLSQNTNNMCFLEAY